MRETSSPADNTAVPIYVSTRILERLFVSTIILLSAFIAIVWAIRVPMFMMPDEVAHADYAFAIFDADRIFRLNRSRPTNFVEPETKYLINASRYRELRYNINATAKTDFSNHVLRLKIDKGAPSPSGKSPADGAPVPYAMVAYPPLYYIVIASTMRLIWMISHHSLIDSFYAGRLLNVLYLTITLTLIYRILAISQKNILFRTLLFSAIALLPMTDWMSGYIQPDNQAALFSAFCVYFCLVLKKHGIAASSVAFLSVSETILALTKPHYAAIVTIGVFLALWSNSLRHSHAALIRLAFANLLIPFASICFSLLILPAGRFQGPILEHAPHRDSLLSLLSSEADNLIRTISDIYFGGAAFQSFWFHFGIRGESAFSIIPRFQSTVVACLVTFTVITLAAGIQKHITVLRRIHKVATLRGRWFAFRFIGNDVHLNVVVMLTVLLLSLSIAANGLFTLQGRYWYPILSSVYIVGVQNFSFALRGRKRYKLSLFACAFLAMFSFIASPSAIAALTRDFYTQPPNSPKSALSEITQIFVDNQEVFGEPIRLKPNSDMTVLGAAINAKTGTSVQDVRYWIDDNGPRSAKTGLKTKRLADIFIDPLLANAGFELKIKFKSLRKGLHVVTIRSIDRRAQSNLKISTITLSVR